MKRILLLVAFCVLATSAQAQVGINATTPDASSALEVRSTAKGLLIPRVALASLTDASTIATPAVSLLIYNTASGVGGGTGYYYNAGTTSSPQWQRLVQQSGLDATNTTVAINQATTSTNIAVINSNLTSTNNSVNIASANIAMLQTGLATTNNNVTSLTNTTWRTTANTLSGTGQLGTSSNQPIDLYTNNAVRGRLGAAGDFNWGATSSPVNTSLLTSVSTSALPFAVNGFSANNGSAVYGSITGANTTRYAAVQGENNSTSGSFNSAGITGINSSATAGTYFLRGSTLGPVAGVVGVVTSGLTYSFGVYGSTPSSSPRSGGLLGQDGGYATGAVGYLSSGGGDYSFYGFGQAGIAGSTAGRSTNGPGTTSPTPTANTHIGIGLYGGVMGGWVRGQVYGLLARGERYSLYVDGPAVTNQPLTQLVALADGKRVATYAPSSPTADVYVRGRAALRDGQVFVPFPAGFAQLLSNPQEATITVTPTGDTRGVFVERVTEAGFYVRENQGGQAQAALNWTATGIRRGSETLTLAPELLDKEFDPRMGRVMSNDADPAAPRQSLWWDGQQPRYDTPPAHKADPNYFTGARPDGAPVKH